MQICGVCGGNCDDGELVRGVCHECRSARKQKDREDRMQRMLDGPSEQIRAAAPGAGPTGGGSAGTDGKGRRHGKT